MGVRRIWRRKFLLPRLVTLDLAGWKARAKKRDIAARQHFRRRALFGAGGARPFLQHPRRIERREAVRARIGEQDFARCDREERASVHEQPHQSSRTARIAGLAVRGGAACAEPSGPASPAAIAAAPRAGRRRANAAKPDAIGASVRPRPFGARMASKALADDFVRCNACPLALAKIHRPRFWRRRKVWRLSLSSGWGMTAP